jgi:hypothetical protein
VSPHEGAAATDFADDGTRTRVADTGTSARVSAHAYPWDVLDDPGFVDRVQESGVDAVTLAISYHSTRAATPLHPTRRLVDARYAALYRPVRPGIWGRLVPLTPDWCAVPDPAGEAVDILHSSGIMVNAWLVLAHNTRLGRLHPDVTVRNCFGERYPYALCPSWAEVVDHCATLAAEALRDLPVSGVSLESCGQMGVAHLGCHEKTEGAYPPLQQRLLSICCCSACGVDPELVRAWFRAGAVPEGVEDAILQVRHAATDRLRAAVLSAVREVAPDAAVTLHGHPDPWATGPSPGLTPTASSDVDTVLVPAWATDTQDAVARAARMGKVAAYVTVLPPAQPAALPDHVRRLRAAGATELALYHLGLANPETAWSAPLFTELGRAFREPMVEPSGGPWVPAKSRQVTGLR